MSNELEKRFTTYLNKTLKGYSNKQKIKYQKESIIKNSLSDSDIRRY